MIFSPRCATPGTARVGYVIDIPVYGDLSRGNLLD